MTKVKTSVVSFFLGTALVAVIAVVMQKNDARIIGGEPAPRGAYPFFSTLVKENGEHICGASLIAPQWVLTAAHCLRNQSPHSVLIGVEQYRPNIEAADRVPIASTYPHPEDDRDGQFDIALVKLARPANSAHFLRLDGMEFHWEHAPGSATLLVGFGVTETGYGPDVLYQGAGTILEDSKCIEVPPGYPDTNFNPENNICAGYSQGSGDSGGPLMVIANGEQLEIGLVTRTLLNQVGQYTRVGYFADWIKQTMEQNK